MERLCGIKKIDGEGVRSSSGWSKPVYLRQLHGELDRTLFIYIVDDTDTALPALPLSMASSRIDRSLSNRSA